jgi:hypothetical protein
MKYRLLPAEEFSKLTPFCERNGVPIPNPELTYVAVVEDGSQIVYMHMAQMQLHLDNQCRDRDYKGYVNIPRIVHMIEACIPRPAILYTYPSYKNGVRLAELSGFHAAEFPLMIKELPCR